MKKSLLYFLPFLLVGAGCASQPSVTTEYPAPGFEGVDEMVVEGTDEGSFDDDMIGGTELEGGEGTDQPSDTPTDTDMTAPDGVSFDVIGTSFAFDVKEMRVKQGDTVTVNFRSENGFHDWVLDAFDARTSPVNTGGTSSVTFVADEKGTFEYYCSIGTHRAMGMVGNIIVE